MPVYAYYFSLFGYVVATQSDRIVILLSKAIDVVEAANSVPYRNDPSTIVLLQKIHSPFDCPPLSFHVKETREAEITVDFRNLFHDLS